MLFRLTFLCFIIGASLAIDLGEELFAWKEVEFSWPSQEAKDEAIKSGQYIPANNLPLGIAKWKNKLFVTVPRWKHGVASSLNYIPLEPHNKTAAFIPYPDWKSNTLPQENAEIKDENRITSVFRVNVDACDRLWVMDTGLADILGNPKLISKPSLLVFDLNTDKLIRKYDFKLSDLKEDSFFANVVVDVQPDKCNESYAYVPDLGGYGVVVYSWADNDSWRVKHNFFHFDPLKGEFNVGGVEFQWTDGVFGLALSNPKPDGSRTMYFHALASTKEFSVPTWVLQNKTVATDPASYHYFKLEGEKGNLTQTSTSVYDPITEVLFMTQLNRDGVACWNTKKPLEPENLSLVAQDKETLIFTNDITIDNERNLYILSDKMPAFIYKSLDPNEINYRIFKVKVDDAIRGTVCA